MLFAHITRRSGMPVLVTNYIKQHKKSTGFRDTPVVFKNGSRKSGQPFPIKASGPVPASGTILFRTIL
jgi:glutaredoxin